MTEDIAILERKFIDKKAAEYRSRGYEVEENCLLEFLPGYRADLIVRKGKEVRVVEVKSRTSLARSPRMTELAEILYDKPDWSYDLLLVGEPEKLESPEGAQSFREEEIRQRLAEAEEVLEEGFGRGRLPAGLVSLRSRHPQFDRDRRDLHHARHHGGIRPRYGGHARHHLPRGPQLSV